MKDDQSFMVLMPRSIVISSRILIKVLSSRFLILNLMMVCFGGRGERTGLEISCFTMIYSPNGHSRLWDLTMSH